MKNNFLIINYLIKIKITMNTNTITITDWILRVGDGENFINSSKYKIWGIQSTNSFGKYFIKHVKIGDRLWFVKSKKYIF